MIFSGSVNDELLLDIVNNNTEENHILLDKNHSQGTQEKFWVPGAIRTNTVICYHFQITLTLDEPW